MEDYTSEFIEDANELIEDANEFIEDANELIKDFEEYEQLEKLIKNHDTDAVKIFIQECKHDTHKFIHVVKDYDIFLVLIGNKSLNDSTIKGILNHIMLHDNIMVVDFLVKYGIDPVSIIHICMYDEYLDSYSSFDSRCYHDRKNKNDKCVKCLKATYRYRLVVYIICKYNIDVDGLREGSNNKLLHLILDNLPVDV